MGILHQFYDFLSLLLNVKASNELNDTMYKEGAYILFSLSKAKLSNLQLIPI